VTVTVGVVEVVSTSQEQTLSGRGARVYRLGVVTGIRAASTGGVLVQLCATAAG